MRVNALCRMPVVTRPASWMTLLASVALLFRE